MRLLQLSRTALFVVFALVVVFLNIAVPAKASFGASRESLPACKGANLVGAFARSNLYAGGGIITLAITNIGTSACRLAGYPTLLGVRDGHEYVLTHIGHGTQDSSLTPTSLAPRESGGLILDNSLGCNANVYPLPVADRFTGLVIVLPKREGRVRVFSVPLSVPCGLSESQMGWAKGFNFE
ncbi:MAG TPA: DUF4232 domain-containing protein [Acidimicrobiales bacterium]